MNCAQLEVLLCGYVDGTLAPAEIAVVEEHLAHCPACTDLARDGAMAVSFMERVADVEPPAELVTRLFHLPATEPMSVPARTGVGRWWQSVTRPLLQPRMAMGLSLTVLFFGMMARCAGMPERHLSAADLDPARVVGTLGDRAHRTYERSVKFYESIRLVYQIQNKLRDWKEQQDAEPVSDANTDDRRLPAHAPSGNAGKTDPAQPGGGARQP